MKKIEAIVRPTKAEEVRLALKEAGCSGLSITEIQGHGRQKGVTQQWRGEEYHLELLPKIKIEIVVKDSDVTKIVGVIKAAAYTGNTGDGKIFISPVEEAVRIRTDDHGEDAI